MYKKWFLSIALGLLLVACRSEQEVERVLPENLSDVSTVDVSSNISEMSVTPVVSITTGESAGESPAALITPVPTPDFTEVGVTNILPLPPYGIQVKADTGVLLIKIVSVQEDLWGRVVELQNMVNSIKQQAQTQGGITVSNVTLEAIHGSYTRVPTTSESESSLGSFNTERTAVANIERSSTIMLELSIGIQEQTTTILDPMQQLSNFLGGLILSNSVSIEPLLFGTKISNPEQYRTQLIAQVYAELAAVKTQYGAEVKYQIIGLYEPVEVKPLNDLEYYLYISPTITVTDF